ncbi:MAG: hypothetical protein GX633_02035 [Clostridiales bacterium]|nr:hypothetical protein [Clostridiales bacterium]
MAKDKRRIIFDKTEISVVDMSGKNPVRINLTYDKIISIQLDRGFKKKFYFLKKECDRIMIKMRGRENPIPIYSVDDQYFEEYVSGLRKFAKDNRITLYDYLAKSEEK